MIRSVYSFSISTFSDFIDYKSTVSALGMTFFWNSLILRFNIYLYFLSLITSEGYDLSVHQKQ
jgi:hypothetical protein